MTQYKLQIAGGMYSVTDVFEAFAQKQPTAITVDPTYKLLDASYGVTEDGLMIGEVVLQTEGKIDGQEIIDTLANQFLGIGFKLEEIEETAGEANS